MQNWADGLKNSEERATQRNRPNKLKLFNHSRRADKD